MHDPCSGRIRKFAYSAGLLLLVQFSSAPGDEPNARLDALQSANRHGLNPQDYEITVLDRWADDPSPEIQQQFETLLNTSYQRYAMDVSQGRSQLRDADPDWHISPPAPLADIEDPAQLSPPHAPYARLQLALAQYEAIRNRGGWDPIPNGPELKTGMQHPHAELARNRLRMTGDYDAFTPANVYLFDQGLNEALRRYQQRNGLWPSGLLNANTRVALNVSVDDRIAQLSLAMERWRWLPRDLGNSYIWINAAKASLEVIENRELVLSMRVIVGHSTRPTPSLASDLSRVVFNPTWSVPDSIASKDLLPRIIRDPAFLSANGFAVYKGWANSTLVDPAIVDWKNIDPAKMPYRFVQAPGPKNSLGLVKVMFDNPYDIYIHDTPSKGLFGLRTRTFSSGCIRLEDAIGFSEFLLSRDREWDSSQTSMRLAQQQPNSVSLNRKIPIYIVYITSWVTESGEVNFRKDLYGRDSPVIAAAQRSTPNIEVSQTEVSQTEKR